MSKLIDIDGLQYYHEKEVKPIIEEQSTITTALDNKVDKVLDSRVYQNVIATASSVAGYTFFFAPIKPVDYNIPYKVKIRVKAYLNSEMAVSTASKFYTETVCEICGCTNTIRYARSVNSINDTSYRPIYYISIYTNKEAGVTAGEPHYLGVSLGSSASYMDTNYKRDIEVELLDYSNCEVSLLDEIATYSDVYNSTYYYTLNNANAATNGEVHTGDIYYVDRLNLPSVRLTAGGSGIYGYQPIVSADGITYASICTSYGTGSGKACYTGGFNPDYIYYYNASGTITSGNNVGSSTVYTHIPVTVTYFWNSGSTLTVYKPVYLKCTYFDGLYYLDTTEWLTQTVPTTDDGYFYIYLGYAYGTSSIVFEGRHPVYKYYNGSFMNINDITRAIMEPVTIRWAGKLDNQYGIFKINKILETTPALQIGVYKKSKHGGGTRFRFSPLYVGDYDHLVMPDAKTLYSYPSGEHKILGFLATHRDIDNELGQTAKYALSHMIIPDEPLQLFGNTLDMDPVISIVGLYIRFKSTYTSPEEALQFPYGRVEVTITLKGRGGQPMTLIRTIRVGRTNVRVKDGITVLRFGTSIMLGIKFAEIRTEDPRTYNWTSNMLKCKWNIVCNLDINGIDPGSVEGGVYYLEDIDFIEAISGGAKHSIESSVTEFH